MKVMKLPKRIASIVWSGVNHAARFARKREWIESEKLPARTIGIGNLQAGGAGKTPLTIRLARDAVAQGLQVAVLMRGYRSAWERTGGILSPYEPAPSPELCGDEPALIHDQVPEAWIGVGADRIAQFEKMQSQATLKTGRHFDLILLDDAYQHWKIRCDQYVLAITDAEVGEFIFRDSFKAVSPNDLIVLTKGDSFPTELANHPHQVKARYRVKAGDPAKRYRFVAALGDPERARASFVKAGYAVEGMTVFPDHHAFSASEIERILEEASALRETVLLSGKDWVKWRALGTDPASVEVVEPEIEISEGTEHWDRLLWLKGE